MCGRFTLKAGPQELADTFPWLDPPRLRARYNIAPSDDILGVTLAAEPLWLHWGLVPRWARQSTGSRPLINARAETVATRPTFREAFKRRRCIIPASGFYEWRRQGDERLPYYITQAGGHPLAFAGLFERRGTGDEAGAAGCILTTGANPVVSPIHERMPLILSPDDYRDWLAPDTPAERLSRLLSSEPGQELTAYPVSRHVNRPANDDPRCCQPL